MHFKEWMKNGKRKEKKRSHKNEAYENTSEPQPAKEVKSLGEKSRAGLSGAPLITPKDNTIKPRSQRPIKIGTIPFGQFMFRLSVTALITRRKKAVLTSLGIKIKFELSAI